ncbi:sigma-70 family RNA polymerase sigma factor [Chamaesiphon sp.]|uniref:sigma-70 family RNA polymerase sigma factor n=1 Tax=Chamaesiphon sp. TaxID=2814140 RepID=UPI0035939766
MSSSVQLYLARINKIPLLTQEQEVLYGKQIQQMLVLVKSKEQIQDLDLQQWADIHQMTIEQLRHNILIGERAKNIFIQSNLRLVVYVAQQYIRQTTHLELLDLIQEGSIGLNKAVEKFNPALGYRFSTYAYWWIRQSINQSISEKGREIRLPTHLREKSNRIRKTQTHLTQSLGRSPSTTEVAAACDMKSGDLRQISTWMQQPYSLDVRIGDKEEASFGDFIEYLGIDPETYVDRQLLHDSVLKLLTVLNPSQQQVIMLRFGLDDGNPLTLAEVGKIMNLSRERVRKIQDKAISILREQRQNINWENN